VGVPKLLKGRKTGIEPATASSGNSASNVYKRPNVYKGRSVLGGKTQINGVSATYVHILVNCTLNGVLMECRNRRSKAACRKSSSTISSTSAPRLDGLVIHNHGYHSVCVSTSQSPLGCKERRLAESPAMASPTLCRRLGCAVHMAGTCAGVKRGKLTKAVITIKWGGQQRNSLPFRVIAVIGN